MTGDFMSMTPEQQKSIIAKESAWVDDCFSQLDLTAYPALQPPPPENTREDNRFAKHWTDTPLTASATALRNFVAAPDAETLERVGNETGNKGFRDEVRQRRGETVAEQFKRSNPDYIPTQNNYQIIATTLAFNALPTSD